MRMGEGRDGVSLYVCVCVCVSVCVSLSVCDIVEISHPIGTKSQLNFGVKFQLKIPILKCMEKGERLGRNFRFRVGSWGQMIFLVTNGKRTGVSVARVTGREETHTHRHTHRETRNLAL